MPHLAPQGHSEWPFPSSSCLNSLPAWLVAEYARIWRAATLQARKWIYIINTYIFMCVGVAVTQSCLNLCGLQPSRLPCTWNPPGKSGLPFPSPWNLPDPGIEPWSPTLKADSLCLSHQGKFICVCVCVYRIHMGFPGGAAVKNLPANEGDQGSVPELGRFPREGSGNPFQYYSPGDPMDKGTWWATYSSWSLKSQTWLSN